MEKVLLTGGTGFLGSHIALYLTLKGYSVRILTRKSLWARQSNLKCIQGEVTDERAVRRAMRDCDLVIHAAAKVSFNEDVILCSGNHRRDLRWLRCWWL
jgi:UDP-glucose 4-epimerase